MKRNGNQLACMKSSGHHWHRWRAMNQWHSMKSIEINETIDWTHWHNWNTRASIQINEINWNQWASIEVNEHQLKSMKTSWTQWNQLKSMKSVDIKENQWKSMAPSLSQRSTNENRWNQPKSVNSMKSKKWMHMHEINEIDRNRRNDEHIWHLLKSVESTQTQWKPLATVNPMQIN